MRSRAISLTAVTARNRLIFFLRAILTSWNSFSGVSASWIFEIRSSPVRVYSEGVGGFPP